MEDEIANAETGLLMCGGIRGERADAMVHKGWMSPMTRIHVEDMAEMEEGGGGTINRTYKGRTVNEPNVVRYVDCR